MNAQVFGAAADVLLLYHPSHSWLDGSADGTYAFLPHIPLERVLLGHFLGLSSIPLEAAGTYLIYDPLKPAFGVRTATASVAIGAYRSHCTRHCVPGIRASAFKFSRLRTPSNSWTKKPWPHSGRSFSVKPVAAFLASPVICSSCCCCPADSDHCQAQNGPAADMCLGIASSSLLVSGLDCPQPAAGAVEISGTYSHLKGSVFPWGSCLGP